MKSRGPSRPWLRPLFLAGGLLCVGLAALGLFLPLVPATPFLLLAAACFARSSERLHQWMLQHRRFGPLLRDWEAHRAIRPAAKRAATAAILASAALTYGFARPPRAARIAVGLSLAGVLAFIWTRPSGPTR